MTNCSYISSIAFLPHPVLGGENQYVPVTFVAGTAKFESKESKTSQGKLFKSALSFKMAGCSPQNRRLLSQMSAARSFQFTDVNGMGFTMHGSFIKPVVTADESIDASPGSFRGYEVSVEWETATRPTIQSFI